MRKALLIAAQDRMDKLNAAPTTAAAVSAAVPVNQTSGDKEEDDIVILQEVNGLFKQRIVISYNFIAGLIQI